MSQPQKKYELVAKTSLFLEPYEIRYLDGREIRSFATSYRNLSQLGSCYGAVSGRDMLFGDLYSVPGVPNLISRGIFETETRIFHRFAFPNKLARFVRS